tara:strand:+ start:388 stop:1041 length:654 start_codon:yes stop_codon:yes gene_type:complete
MEIINLGNHNSILNNFIREIRDVNIQSDSMRFRRNIERIGEIFSYEISKRIQYYQEDINTPLGVSKENIINQYPILATILRAGIPFHQGFLNYFDHSSNAFISAYRKHHPEGGFSIEVEYLSTPDINNNTIILCDPMLATGESMKLALDALLTKGTPKHIHIASIISSQQGVDYIQNIEFSNQCTLWVAAIDKNMTDQSYIIPGLGDAGDLSYGKKL